MSTQNLFHTIVVYSKPSIKKKKKNGICYLESGLLKVEIRLI